MAGRVAGQAAWRGPAALAIGAMCALGGVGTARAVPVMPAADVRVSIDTRNSTTNPGPFSSGASTTFALDFHIDGSVTPGGATPSWAGALDDLVIEIDDAALGHFTVTGRDGRWQQMSTTTDFLFGGWGGVNGGTLDPFSVVNPSISATPFVLTAISFDLRGNDLLDDPAVLTGPQDIADFSYLSLVLSFSNADPDVGVIPKSAIIRGSAFQGLTISPVPEPASLALWAAGLGVIGWRASRRRPVR